MGDQNADKINLNASDDDGDDEDVNFEDFRIRPQFQGRHGQELLELSSKLPERFKLDERFAEVFETDDLQEVETTDEVNEEKKKNIRILESILGHEVGTKSAEKNKSMKKQVRFDPEDENTSHLVKNPETSEKPKKSKKKKKVIEEKVEQSLPISTERYVEVCPNLKEVLNAATPFSFSQQFNQDVKVENSHNTFEFYPEKHVEQSAEIETPEFKKKKEYQIQKQYKNSKQTFPKTKSCKFLFFVKEGDPRLKEGIKFFKRPKPLDEIRVEWQERRERVLEHFRRKKRLSQQSYSTRVQSVQNKFSIRRQNFKK